MFPAVLASISAKWVTVPHDPVGVTNVIAAALLVAPDAAAVQSAPAVDLRA
jgi:hypothetical protein